MAETHIIFDGPPGPESGRFVEVEDAEGQGVNAGEWRERPDGFWALVLNEAPELEALKALNAKLIEALRAPTHDVNDFNCIAPWPGETCAGCDGDELREAALATPPNPPKLEEG